MRKLIFRYSLILLAGASCRSHSASPVISKELQDAVNHNDTALIEKLAQKELDKMRSSIPDSTAEAALTDAAVRVQSLDFKIQKNKPADRDQIITDSLIASKEEFERLYSYMKKVYSFALKKSIQKSDIDYYTEKLSVSSENWISNNFTNKTKRQLQVSRLLLQKDIAIASAIINNIDMEIWRSQTEDQYKNMIKLIEQIN